MSRFSKAEAESAGWIISHQRDEYEVTVGPGLTQKHPATIVAEKYLSLPGAVGQLIHEEASTEGLLLERIHAYEQHLKNTDAFGENTEPVEVDTSNELPVFSPLYDSDGEGDPVQSVIFPTEPGDLSFDAPVDTMTDAEWSARTRADTLVVKGEDGERKQVIYAGSGENAEDAEALRLENKKAIEDRRAAEPAVGPREQLSFDTAGAVDSPGIGAGGSLIVREGEEAGDIIERKEALKKMREEGRVSSHELQGEAVAPEGADKLAGLDVGIQERGDLGSEQPPQGSVASTLAEPEDEIEENPAPHLYPEGAPIVSLDVPDDDDDEASDRSDDQESAAKEARDSSEASSPFDPNASAAVAPDDDADPDEEEPEDDEVDATEAAKAKAEELDVDISEVKGTGKDGRVIVPDVEAAASDE